jgi:hypothetical protein
MKTRHLILSLILTFLALAGCREITVTTKVNSDGSFTRVVKVTGDSSEVFKMDLPYPVDTTWERTVKKDTGNKPGYTVIYTKFYADDDLLNLEIRNDTGWMHTLNRRVTVSKKFGFFYTFLTFNEICYATNPFRALDYKKYMSADDLLWLARRKAVTSPADSSRIKEVEDKAMAFLVESATAEIEQILKTAIVKLNDPRLNPADVPKYHDSIRDVLSKWNFKNAEELAGYYRKWTGNPAAERLGSLASTPFAGFDEKGKFIETLVALQDYREEAEMPGLITGTNSIMLKGNLVSWDVTPMAFLLEDYVMSAESRVINTWAFILTGSVLLTLVVLLVIRVVRR